MLAAGLFFGWSSWHHHSDLEAYRNAPACRPGQSSDCWSETPATVVRAYTQYESRHADTYHVQLAARPPIGDIQLASPNQWRYLHPGYRVSVVRFRGETVGLNVGGALFPSADYPGQAQLESVLRALPLIGWGVMLLLAVAYGTIEIDRNRPTPRWVPVGFVALATAPMFAVIAWGYSGSVAAAALAALGTLIVVGVPVAFGLRKAAKRREPLMTGSIREVPSRRLGGAVIVTLLTVGTFAMLAVVGLDGALATARPLNCATYVAGTRPVVGLCQTTMAQLADALVPASLDRSPRRWSRVHARAAGAGGQGGHPGGIDAGAAQGRDSRRAGGAGGERAVRMAGGAARPRVRGAVPASRPCRTGGCSCSRLSLAYAAANAWDSTGGIGGIGKRLWPMNPPRRAVRELRRARQHRPVPGVAVGRHQRCAAGRHRACADRVHLARQVDSGIHLRARGPR